MAFFEKRKKKDFTILVVPSYRCNASCAYCYAKDYKDRFGEMDFLTFVEVINRHKKDGGTSINLIGGEPTIWKHINKAIIYCKMRGVKTTVLTNGLEPINVKPWRFYININHYFESPEKKEKMIRTLEFYAKKKVIIGLRYNMDMSDPPERIDKIIGLALKYKANIDVVPAIPYEISEKVGERIFEIMFRITDLGLQGKLPNPLPPCMFSKHQLDYLKRNNRYFSACGLGGMPLVNPDGKTVQVCSKVFTFKDIDEIGSLRENAKFKYSKEIDALQKNLPLEKCHTCEYHKNKQCYGGCLASRAEILCGNLC